MGKDFLRLTWQEEESIAQRLLSNCIAEADGAKIIFCRVRKAEGDNANRFYVHEVFAEDEIEEQGALPSDRRRSF